jgi:hypothetical protein
VGEISGLDEHRAPEPATLVCQPGGFSSSNPSLRLRSSAHRNCNSIMSWATRPLPKHEQDEVRTDLQSHGYYARVDAKQVELEQYKAELREMENNLDQARLDHAEEVLWQSLFPDEYRVLDEVGTYVRNMKAVVDK